MRSSNIRVLLANKHAAMRACLCRFLDQAEHVEAITEAGEGTCLTVTILRGA